MRFLYFTDTHIRGTSPRSRLDDFVATLKLKLEEIVKLASTHNIDFVLHGGDLFDRPNLAPAVVSDFIRIFKGFTQPIYAIAGNHDIYGHNPVTVERTMLGLLEAVGTLHLIQPGEKIMLCKDDLRVQLSGQAFHYELDRRDVMLDYAVTKDDDAAFAIHMVHGMLVERALPESVAHTMVDQVWSEDVDVLLTGHYHAGFPTQHKDGKYIINPGAVSRINNHLFEINRMPKVVIIDFSCSHQSLKDTLVGPSNLSKIKEASCAKEISIEEIPLSCAVSGDEVLDRTYIENASYRQEKLADFVQQVQASSDFRGLDLTALIEEIAQMHDIDPEVKAEARRRIGLMQEKIEVCVG